MDFLVQRVSFVVFSGFVALATRLAGRLFARTTIQWALCFKYALMVVASLFVMQFLGLIGATAVTGFGLGVLLAIAAHAVVGAIYLGIGRLRGAMAGVGVAFLWMSVSAMLLLAMAMLGFLRG